MTDMSARPKLKVPATRCSPPWATIIRAHRDRIFRKLRRAGLDTLILPDDSDVQNRPRLERLIKRNLYRALYTLERIRAARQGPQSLDAAPLPEPLKLGGDLLDENKF